MGGRYEWEGIYNFYYAINERIVVRIDSFMGVSWLVGFWSLQVDVCECVCLFVGVMSGEFD